MTGLTGWIGPCATPLPSGDPDDPVERVVLDRAGLLRRLLLFETVMLHSYQLLEARDLVAMFGREGLSLLLQSGCLKIRCEAFSFGVRHQSHRPLPPNTFEIVSVRATNERAYTSRCLQNVQNLKRVTFKEGLRLKRDFADALVQSPSDAGKDAINSAKRDAERPEVLQAAIAGAVEARLGKSVPLHSITCKGEKVADGLVRVDSNLAKLGVEGERLADEIHEGAVLAIVRVNDRIEQMQTFNALSGTLADDLMLLETKLSVVAKEVDPNLRESEFRRVVELRGFPTAPEEIRIDVESLLRVRASPECREFRDWLRTASHISDHEVTERVGGLGSVLASAFASTPGRVVRFLTTTGVGLIPGVGTVAGPVLSALDTFLVEKAISQPGPAAFVSSKYPSLFRKR